MAEGGARIPVTPKPKEGGARIPVTPKPCGVKRPHEIHDWPSHVKIRDCRQDGDTLYHTVPVEPWTKHIARCHSCSMINDDGDKDMQQKAMAIKAAAAAAKNLSVEVKNLSVEVKNLSVEVIDGDGDKGSSSKDPNMIELSIKLSIKLAK